MILRTIKIGTNRPGLDFLEEVKAVDLDLYAKLEDLLERIWNERSPPPKLPRDASENYGDGLLVLKARGLEKWGRIAYTYDDDRCRSARRSIQGSELAVGRDDQGLARSSERL